MSKFSKTLLAATAAFLVSGTAAQADNSLVFDVTGEVPEICEATTFSIGAVEDIDLTTTAEQKLGGITYTCNHPGGFTREISSANNGELIHPSDPDGVAYNVKHGGGSGLSFSPTPLTTPIITNLSGSGAFADGQTGSFYVQLPTVPTGLFAGDYTDTITVAVTGN